MEIDFLQKSVLVVEAPLLEVNKTVLSQKMSLLDLLQKS